MKYLSLFSGIGGFEYGLDNSKHNFECIGFSEIDKYAKSIYKRHYPNHIDLGDVLEIRTEDLPDFDFLVGGFPCQAFSNAGKKGGFDDTRGTLFFEISRILNDKRPRYFLLENVRGLLSHNKGKTFKRILEVLSDLGYNVKWEIFNSKDYGVPQRRERVFIKGYFGGECGSEVLSFRRTDAQNNAGLVKLNHKKQAQEVFSTDGLVKTLSANGGGQGGKTGLYMTQNVLEKQIDNNFVRVDENRFVTSDKEKENCYALTTRCRSRPLHRKQDNYVLEKHLKLRETTKKGYKEAYPYDGVLVNRGGRKIAKGIVQQGKTGTLMANPAWGTVTADYQIRRLTPIECERLQAFPDNWTQYGCMDEEISDTQRYKCLGNAVTTTVITAIADEMFDGCD